ncbi:MAG TPA: LacI family DNA-binding transcriptional regulator [Propionicimonas sp.]|uniref:LacI family DNA-binding transcriptional regulator n=1 Tax=Propionicimonas sp. TaxID=1955623 RepID=UPI002F4164B4
MTGTRPGPATIYAVAASAGVSIATVSRVLQGAARVSDATRAKVMEAVRTLDYLPRGSARALAAKKHEAVGLMLPELTGPYFAELLVGFESAAAGFGLSVALLMTDEPGLSRPLRQLAARVDGLAVMARPGQLADEEVDSLARRLPLVRLAAGVGAHAISTENTDSACELTEHLFGHGRRRLVFVGDPELAPDGEERYAGFVAAHARAGLRAAGPLRVGYSEQDGRRVAHQLLAAGALPDGLVCANDELAVALLDELQRAGLAVPDDLAITGWDDVMTARYTRPGLTSVAQPVRELGVVAATTLHRWVTTGEQPTTPTILPTRVVLRGSCGCPEATPPATRPLRMPVRETLKEEPE